MRLRPVLLAIVLTQAQTLDAQSGHAQRGVRYQHVSAGAELTPLAGLACPTGSISGFAVFDVDCPTGPTLEMSWNAPSGADASTVYEVLRSDFYGDVCATPPVSQMNFSVIGTTSARTFSYDLASPVDRVYAHYRAAPSRATSRSSATRSRPPRRPRPSPRR